VSYRTIRLVFDPADSAGFANRTTFAPRFALLFQRVHLSYFVLLLLHSVSLGDFRSVLHRLELAS
jgi:hypothetical protein